MTHNEIVYNLISMKKDTTATIAGFTVHHSTLGNVPACHSTDYLYIVPGLAAMHDVETLASVMLEYIAWEQGENIDDYCTRLNQQVADINSCGGAF